MSVDLPAPFSPTRAWISRGLIVRSTLSNASVLRKRFVRPLISIAGSASVAMAFREMSSLCDYGVTRRRHGKTAPRKAPSGQDAGFRPHDRWETNLVTGL